MKTNLDLLIAHYAIEKENLENLIEECLKFGDYFGAHCHQKGLFLAKNKLRSLQRLKDPNYHRKAALQSEIQRLHHKIKQQQGREHLAEWIEEARVKLQILDTGPRPYVDAQQLDDQLQQLLDNTYHSLRIQLLKEQNLYLDLFARHQARPGIRFNLTPFPKLQNPHVILERHIRQLHAIGMFHDPVRDCLKMEIDWIDQQSSLHLKTILSRIFFDVFQMAFDKNTPLICIKFADTRIDLPPSDQDNFFPNS